MGLESASFIPQLVASNPVGATDPKSQGDDHLRLLKQVLQNQFPNIGTTAVTATAAQLNAAATLSGVITGFAAPTNKIGNAANAAGSASTAMRSDATIQLDVTLPYTWTGAHIFNSAIAFNAAVTIKSPSYFIGNVTTGFRFNNAADTRNLFMIADTGTMTFGNTTDNPAYNFLGTGTATHSGPITVNLSTNQAALILNSTQAAQQFWQVGGVLKAVVGAAAAANDVITGSVAGDVCLRSNSGRMMLSADNGNSAALQITTANVVNYNGIEVGYRSLISRLVTSATSFVSSDNGRAIAYTGAGGDTFTITSTIASQGIVTIINAGSGSLTITESLAGSLYWFNGSGSIPLGSRTLSVGGVATVWYFDASNAYIWGVGLL